MKWPRPDGITSGASDRRLLVLCEYPTLGGGEFSLFSTVPYVQRAGFEVVIAAPPRGPLAEAVSARRMELVPFQTHDDGERRLSQSSLRDRLSAILRQTGPRLLHANSLSMGRLSGPVAGEMGLPSIAHLRDILRLSKAAVADLNRHRCLVAVSHATRDAHVRQGIDGRRTRVIHNGVDLNGFRPADATGWLHRELGLRPDTLLIGSIGQLIIRKGQDVLATAARRLAREFPRLHYVFVGSRFSRKEEARQYEDDLHTAFASGEFVGRGHFLGLRDDVPRILPELTMLVHTARQEPLGRVLLEAAAAGVPIVATDVGGTREIFPASGEAAAVIVPPGEPATLAVAIRELMLHPARRNRLGRAARRRAESTFDVSVAARRLVELYREVLEPP